MRNGNGKFPAELVKIDGVIIHLENWEEIK
jgi:hypothetical protein